jgi:hypothetical protein
VLSSELAREPASSTGDGTAAGATATAALLRASSGGVERFSIAADGAPAAHFDGLAVQRGGVTVGAGGVHVERGGLAVKARTLLSRSSSQHRRGWTQQTAGCMLPQTIMQQQHLPQHQQQQASQAQCCVLKLRTLLLAPPSR